MRIERANHTDKKPTYKVVMDKEEVLPLDFENFMDACDMVHYLNGGDMTESLKGKLYTDKIKKLMGE